MANIIPPRTQKCILPLRHFVRQYLNTLIIKRRKSTQDRIKHTTQRPHIHTLTIPLILHNLRCRIPHCTTGCHSLFIPHNLRKSKVRNLDAADPTTTGTRYEFPLVFFVFVVGPSDDDSGRDDLYAVKEEVFGFDVAMDDTAFFMEVAYTLGYLEDYMAREVFAEVCQFDNLVEE